jgi:alkyldihydroxyacetonephosphate synthase
MKSWIESLVEEFGPDRILTSDEALAAHSYDTWPIGLKWRQQGKMPYRPEAVFRPESREQVRQLLAWASGKGVPVTPWGAGSGVTGAALPVHGGIILDMSALNRLLFLDEANLLVRVEAGMLGITLEEQLNSRGFTLNHSPQSLSRSTVGGWVATSAMGQFSSRWGGIEDLLAALTIVLPDGQIVETPLAPRMALGPDLKRIFIGSEGTLGVVTDITLKIFPQAEHRIFDTLNFPTVAAGLNAMRKMIQSGLRPFLVRLYDEDESRYLLPEDGATRNILLLGFEGLARVAQAEYDAAIEICVAQSGELLGPATALRWMERRFDFSVVESRLKRPQGFAETIEVAHFWEGILQTHHSLKEALAPYADQVLCHFSHVYPQGTSLYTILMGEATDAASAEQQLLRIWEVAMETCLQVGAALVHHHGIGLARQPYLPQALGANLDLFRRVKSALDPAGILNPGKLGVSDEETRRL